ncbi:MAG: hypothetical protein IMW98_00155 [Firmicutes bacterium]|nr:hypothetical protein [Bacillota bacterium]
MGQAEQAPKERVGYFALAGFFAQVERVERGGEAPVVVIRDGRVLDRDAAAKEAGVRLGQAEVEARQACPRARFIPYVAARYRAAADQVMAAAYALSPVLEPDGEAAGWFELGRNQSPEEVVESLSAALIPRWGIRLLTGFGPNPWTAQLAALRLASPANPFPVVAAASAADALAPLPVAVLDRVLPGISPRLQALGLHTLGQVAAVPPPELRRALGEPALAAQGYSRGEDGRRVRPLWPRAAVVEAVDFSSPLSNLETVSHTLDRLAAALARRLRDKGQAGRQVALEVLTEDGRARRAERRFTRPRADAAVAQVLHFLWAGELWPELARGSRGALRIVRLAASVSDLCERPWAQVGLWQEPSAAERTLSAGGRVAAEREAARPEGLPSVDRRKLPQVVQELRARFPSAHVGFGAPEAADWREERLAFWDPLRWTTQSHGAGRSSR